MLRIKNMRAYRAILDRLQLREASFTPDALFLSRMAVATISLDNALLVPKAGLTEGNLQTGVLRVDVPKNKRWHLLSFTKGGTSSPSGKRAGVGGVELNLETATTAESYLYLREDFLLDGGDYIYLTQTSDAGDTNRWMQYWVLEEDYSRG